MEQLDGILDQIDGQKIFYQLHGKGDRYLLMIPGALGKD